MASYTRRGDGYTVRWRDPDGTERRRQVPDLATAKRARREIERCSALGLRWEPDAGRDPLPAIFDAYLKDRKRRWRPNTHRTADIALSLFESWLRARTRRRVLDPGLLTQTLLAEWWDHVRFGRGCSVRTANAYTRIVQQAWAWADNSDAYGAAVPRPRTIDVPDPTERQAIAPTWAQMDAAIAGARREHWRRLLVLLRCTGLRIEQATRLVWDDVDMGRCVLRIRPELGKTRQERKGRVVPVAPVLAEEMAGWGVREGALTGAPRGVAWHPDANVRQRVWIRAGVPEAVWRDQPAHAFRKGFRTELRAAGAEPDAVDFLVGHARPGMRERYDDPRCLPLVGAVERVPPIGAGCVPGVSRLPSAGRSSR